MADINFNIRGNEPPFNGYLLTGSSVVIDSFSGMTASGATGFTNVPDVGIYTVKVSDGILNTAEAVTALTTTTTTTSTTTSTSTTSTSTSTSTTTAPPTTAPPVQPTVFVGMTTGGTDQTNTNNPYVEGGTIQGTRYKVWFTTKGISGGVPIYDDRTGNELVSAVDLEFSISQLGLHVQDPPAIAGDDLGEVEYKANWSGSIPTDGIVLTPSQVSQGSTASDVNFTITLPIGFKAGAFDMSVRLENSGYNGAAQSFSVLVTDSLNSNLGVQQLQSIAPYIWGVVTSLTDQTEIELGLLE